MARKPVHTPTVPDLTGDQASTDTPAASEPRAYTAEERTALRERYEALEDEQHAAELEVDRIKGAKSDVAFEIGQACKGKPFKINGVQCSIGKRGDRYYVRRGSTTAEEL